MSHLLVTNDFPPKVGGIQSYLWELWRRLPAGEATVLTTPHDDAEAFDAAAPLRIERSRRRALLPTPALAADIRRLTDEVDAELILLDPVVPLGALARWLDRPYGVIVHGAEMTIPGRVPGYRTVAADVLRRASVVIAAGGYPRREAERAARIALPTVVVPPGVDVDRFHPHDATARRATRRRFDLPAEARVVLGVSRLVPRKGFDVLVRAAGALAPGRPDLVVAIAGAGRDRARLERLATRYDAPVRFLGAVDDADLPALYASADVFAMACRNRWGGLEQEGFGIVFLEAAACGVPAIAGRSGGSHEAVVDGVTGVVLDHPRSATALARALAGLLADPERRSTMGAAARARAVDAFGYDALAADLLAGIRAATADGGPAIAPAAPGM